MADQVTFDLPRDFVPPNVGDDNSFQAMATFKVMPNNQLQLIEIEGHRIGAGPFERTGPRRIARAARAHIPPVPVASPAAAPPAAVPAVTGMPRAPVAAQPGFSTMLAQKFRTATGR